MQIAIYATAILLNLGAIGYALLNLWLHEKQFTKSVEMVCHVCYAALSVSVLLNVFVIYRLLINISDYLAHPWKSSVWLTVGFLTVVLQYFVGHICTGIEHDRFSRLYHGSGRQSTR
jgi:uncharacterized membrane protein YoaK (UPF0700 family)